MRGAAIYALWMQSDIFAQIAATAWNRQNGRYRRTSNGKTIVKLHNIMNKNLIQFDGRRSAYASPSVRTCKCVTERGFAQSSDFNDLDFENRDEE